MPRRAFQRLPARYIRASSSRLLRSLILSPANVAILTALVISFSPFAPRRSPAPWLLCRSLNIWLDYSSPWRGNFFERGRGAGRGGGIPLKWRPPHVRTYLEQLYRPKRFDLSALIIRVAIEIRERFEGNVYRYGACWIRINSTIGGGGGRR